MAGFQTRGLKSHWKRLKAASGISVTYTQDNESINLTVVPGLSTTGTENADGLIQTSKDSDFLIYVSDLVFAAGIKYPKRRDKIQYVDEVGFDRVFEVVLGPSERHYDPMDQYGLMIRVHTVEMSITPPAPVETSYWIWQDLSYHVNADGDNMIWAQ